MTVLSLPPLLICAASDCVMMKMGCFHPQALSLFETLSSGSHVGTEKKRAVLLCSPLYLPANQTNAESMFEDKRKQILQFIACVPACSHTLVKIKNGFHFKIQHRGSCYMGHFVYIEQILQG